MSKKSRRSRAKYQAKETKAIQERHLQQPGQVVQDTTKPAATKPRMPGISQKSLRPAADYSYVGGELKYIGILGGSLVAILIILSFILG